MHNPRVKTKGFTLLELTLVVAIFAIVFGSGSLVFGNILGKNALQQHGYQLVQNLREARTNSISQKGGNSAWGIYFANSSLPNNYTIFEGDSYATRNQNSDINFEFPNFLTITSINLSDSKEIVFEESTGNTVNKGQIVLTTDRLNYAVTINELGLIDYRF